MSLKVLTGRSGSGKTSQILDEIVDKINQRTNENIILFVPEQMSFQAEYEITKRVEGKTVSNLQVLSFKRLAYRIFLEVGGANKTFISDQTIFMMLTKIMSEQKDQFKLYHRISPNYNFITMIYDVIKEMKNYAMSSETFDHIASSDAFDPGLKDKMHDFHIIFDELLRLYGDTLLDEEDFYSELSHRIQDSDYLKNAIIYIDGYHSLTTVEMNVVLELIRVAKEVKLLLTIDNLEENDFHEPESLFHPVFEMASKLFNRCHEENLGVELIGHLTSNRRFTSLDLAFLESHFEDPIAIFEDEPTNIHIYECMSPKSEVHRVARKIYEAVLNGAHFNDYVIYTNNEQVYYPLIKNIFSLYHIPVFIDDQKKMLDHSLLNFVDAALEIVKTNYRHEAMFRAIKTEMFMPVDGVNTKNYRKRIANYREQIDQLENYCLAHGINHRDWLTKEFTVDYNKKLNDRSKVKTDQDLAYEKQLKTLKNQIIGPLSTFVQSFTQAKSLKEQVESLYQLIIDVKVEEKLALYEAVDLENSHNLIEFNNVKKHKQVFNQLVELFDELVSVVGDYEVDTNSLIKMLQNGFKAMNFQTVPPALEQVMVGNVKRSRFGLLGHSDDEKSLGVKKAFVLGVNENEFPMVYQEKGLLTNKEREELLEQGIDCDKTVEQAFLDENFLIYTVLTSASETLYLSYCLSGDDKKASYRSFVIDDLLTKFPKLSVETIYDFPSEEEDPFPYIPTIEIATSNLLESLSLLQKGYSVHEAWYALYNYYENQEQLREKLAGLWYKNVATDLEEDEVKQLYGDTITASISAVERYNACPYSFFLEKGLGLKERDLKKVEVMDIGDLYHATLKELTLLLMKEGKELHELSFHEIEHLVNEKVNAMAKIMQRDFFNDNERNAYLLKKIKDDLLHSIEAMQYQSKHASFKVFAVEEMFGHNAERLIIPEKELSNGFKMRLKGFIDRIDYTDIDDKTFVRIIDYKSGQKDIDFSKIYYRLSLQLFTYLDVVMQNSESLFKNEVIPAGLLYYHIFSSQVKAKEEMSIDAIIAEHYKQYQMTGYTIEDPDASVLFDDQLAVTKKSSIVRLALTKDGYHKTQAKVLSRDEIDGLRTYARTAIEESVLEMTNGKIGIEPVKYADEPPLCTYCPYKSVCKLDKNLKENHFKLYNKFKDKDEVFNRIKTEMEGGN